MSVLQRMLSLTRRGLDAESRALFRNSSWFFLTNVNAAFCDFLRSVVLARGLGAESFGIFILVTTLVRTIQEFFNLNVGTALVKFGAEYTAAEEPRKLVALLKTCYALAAITAAASVLFVVAMSLVAYETFVSSSGYRQPMQLYAIAASLSFFDYVSISLLNLHFKFRLNSIIKMGLDVIEVVILGVATWMSRGDVQILIGAAGAALLIKAAVYNGAALWEMRASIQPHATARLAEIREDRRRIGGFLLNNSLARTAHTAIFSGDVLLLGALAGPAQVGYYTIAKKLAFSILRVTDPMAGSIFPQFAKLVAERRFAEVRLMLQRTTTTIGAMIGAVFLLALAAGEPVMVAAYGADYRPAAASLMLLVAAAGLGATVFWSTSLIQSLGRVDARLQGYLAALAVSGVVAWTLIPAYGATGLAVAMLVALIVMQSVFVSVCLRGLRD